MPRSDSLWRPLGELLVDRGLIVADELRAALAEQKRSGKRLGEILVAQSAVTPSQLTRILAEQMGLSLDRTAPRETEEATAAVEPPASAWRPLGEVLLERGALPEAELEDALRLQRETGRRLGEILVHYGYVSARDLVAAVMDQHGLGDLTATRALAPTLLPATSHEVYQVEDHDPPGPRVVFRSEGMLDAIDFAFEYLEAQRPARLLVFRTYGKKREEVWAYDEQEADHAATPQELVDVFGFDVVRWRGPSS